MRRRRGDLMRTRNARRAPLVVALLAGLLVLAVPATAQETTEPPATTEAPAPTEAPVEESDDTTNVAIALGVILAILGIGALLVAIFGGRRKEPVPAPTAAPVVTSTQAQDAYATSRWLYDNMTEDLAVWRGNAQFEGTAERGATAATSQADTWEQLAARLDQATDALYGLEAAARDEHTASLSRSVVTGLNAVRASLDSRAQAQYNYRSVEAQQGEPGDPAVLAQARERVQRSSHNLAAGRTALAGSLDNLATIA